jgi:hypothetical protein
MRDLTKQQIRERVKNRDYSDAEWNKYNLWRYVNYKSEARYINEV